MFKLDWGSPRNKEVYRTVYMCACSYSIQCRYAVPRFFLCSGTRVCSSKVVPPRITQTLLVSRYLLWYSILFCSIYSVRFGYWHADSQRTKVGRYVRACLRGATKAGESDV